MSYFPETCEDLSFSGIAEGAERCRVHDLPARRCVVFEGMNTGRRFHTCCVQDYVENCGFVSWVDAEELPESLKKCLTRLWSMYHDSSDKRIEERLENAKVVQELVDDRDKLKKNYYSLMDNVDKLMKDQELLGMKDNLKQLKDEVVKLNSEVFDLKEKKQWESIGSSENAMERRELEAEVLKLHLELFDLKEEKQQWESMEKITKEKWEKKEEAWKEEKKQWESMEMITKEKWEEKEEAWKEEKKKLEYTLFDLFNVNNDNKEKLLKIKEIVGKL